MIVHEDLPYVKHILDALYDIEDSVEGKSKTAFKKNKDVCDACIRRLEVIGEASKNISEQLKKRYPEVVWKHVTGTRNVMIHAYFRVDLDIVWEIIQKDLPFLKEQMLQIKKDLENKNRS